MNKKKSLPMLVKVGVITAVTAIIWVGFEVYRSATVKPPPSVPESISNQLDPTLDLDTLNSLQDSVFLEESQIGEATITNPDQVVQESDPEEVAEPSPITQEVDTTNESTESATIEEEI